ncbi:MAG: hypothetical protein ACYDG2_04315 [Ruminiclostridium sp.]
MNNIKGRKYARTSKKMNSLAQESDDSEFSLSSTAALGILGGTFLVGLISGKLMYMCMKKNY